MGLLPIESAAVSEFCGWVRARFGDRVRALALFGSRARGDGDENSDVDLLVVIEALTGAERREIGNQSGDAVTNHDVIVAPFALSAARWEELRSRERLIAREIERDQVPL
jgi:predicted nucleotidyltransferase